MLVISASSFSQKVIYLYTIYIPFFFKGKKTTEVYILEGPESMFRSLLMVSWTSRSRLLDRPGDGCWMAVDFSFLFMGFFSSSQKISQLEVDEVALLNRS